MSYIPWWQRLSPPTFAERFDLGGLAGRVGFADGPPGTLPKNIRLTEYGKYRFSSEATGKFFSKTFNTLKEAETFRDNYLEDLGIEKGQLRKKTTEKYKSVKNEPHIKFNGKTYQVSVQRMKDGEWVTEAAEYTDDLNEAKKLRDLKVKKTPAKLPFEVVDKSVDVNKD